MSTESELKEMTAGDVDTTRLSAWIAERAEEVGLLDLAYCEVDSPIGRLLVVATPAGLVKLGFSNVPIETQLEQLSAAISPRLLEAPARLDPVRRELEEYFSGDRREFDVPIDWRLTGGFIQLVLRETARIPFGETRTYAEMAAGAGSPRAFRAAGSALGANPVPVVVPCHRVLRTGGGIGGYTGGLDIKLELLRLEGVLD